MELKEGKIAMKAIASARIVVIAPQTPKWFVACQAWLYEQFAHPKRIGQYVRRWLSLGCQWPG